MDLTRLSALLRRPETAATVPLQAWSGIIADARRTQTIGQLAAVLEAENLLRSLPEGPTHHLRLALLHADNRGAAAKWEIRMLRRQIPADCPIVVLKGCAYTIAGLAPGRGRLYNDIDIMVPRKALDEVEGILIGEGWKPSELSPYDERYYRELTHELPPMQHIRRHVALDLHHAIVPPISPLGSPASPLFDQVESVNGLPGVHVLGKADRIIHCAIHMAVEGDLTKTFRDCYDLFRLLQSDAPAAMDLAAVVERAHSLNLAAELLTALRCVSHFFETPAGWGAWEHQFPQGIRTRLMAWAAISGIERQSGHPLRAIGRAAFLVNSHLIKMPIPTLLRHTAQKMAAALPGKPPRSAAADS